ncbi:MAG: nuclear transport factor 2 family protein [Actinomycetota bacterium]
MAHANQQLIESAYEAFGSGDIQALFGMWTDDITWHDAGNHPLAGDHTGKEAVAGFLAGLAERTSGSFRAELQHALADESQGYSLHKSVAEKGGENLEAWTVLGYRFEDGRFAEIWTFDFDQRVTDRMLS